ncbi:armadillo repeat-containing protein gudu [Apis mellifera caucasica]|uniref:Armadillo repeat-containing protein gudu n=1 Tax=Apis mellifera TaxID=7460 RepID=A0A7M7MKY8_APIME|nr:armadillo repeat-containing protein gudu [Apis mellifera]XP_026297532.1 armadillo repeat-containing protein gudu [Apis mellifera]KAG6798342.1 armadillo repeat-containing protein gudu [Apis mellifera caucasica]KAG9434771.1 armadillo repeat-containing protein gudu [Apis mellifera carnica]|eukprot:XP_026297531.1 armadillo repeat-containing protein gudu [Apis mellifera]
MPPKRKKDAKKISIDPPPTIEPDILEVLEPEEAPKPLISAVTGQPFGPRVHYISEKKEDESSDDEPESEIDEEVKFFEEEGPEVPSEFWHIQKLIRYMKAGNQTATMVAVCLLKDHDLSNRTIQKAIRDMGGLEILVNLLETKDLKCQNGSLSVLLQIIASIDMRRHLIDLGIVTPLIQMLKYPARDIQVLAAETMAIVARIRKARKQIRIRNGIPLILDVMDIPDSVLQTPYNNLNEANKELIKVAIACAKVLDSLSSSPKIRELLHNHGVVSHMERFLKSQHISLIIPMIGTIHQCANRDMFRKSFEKTDIIYDVVRHLKSDNIKLQENCALAIFKCGLNKVARDMVRQSSGLDILCKLLEKEEVRANKRLLAAITGGIWKCALSPENVIRFNQNNLIASLVQFLEEIEDEEVQANVVGALAECCKDPVNRDRLRINEGLPNLIKLLSSTYEPLLENIPLVIKECAQNEMCMDIINDPEHVNDGVRLVWSLLKHPSDRIKINSCLALVPCIKYAKDSPEMVRAFVGGLELTVSLLDNSNNEVLSAVCATIAEIAVDPENLGILSDHGVVDKLAALVNTRDENLRANLTLAIAHCCEWGENNFKFGQLQAVAPLISYMTSKNKDVLRGVCIATYHLSREPMNCITMHSAGIIKHILRLVGSEDPELQIAAASTIRNIRKLALTAEKLHFREITTLKETDYLL